MNSLPYWLGLFIYHDLLGGEIPLASFGANLLPALAFILVYWLVLLVGVNLLLVIAESSLRGAVQWFSNILAGFALAVYVPALFSPAVAVILNNLGLGFFLFVSAGLLGISLMAQRLARSLASERQRVAELTALNALAHDIIHSPSSVQATGDLLAHHAPRFLPGADFQLCLFDERTPSARQIVADWRDGAAQPSGDAPLTPAWTWILERRKSLLHTAAAPAPLPFEWDEVQDGPLPGSLLLIPLLATAVAPQEERCIGGLWMSHARPDAFAPQVLPSVTALANQLSAALENARLHQESLARERLERELALARGIQTSFLPAGVPQVEGWNFVASLQPARHVSGDFYDFIPLPDGRWGLLIADVADKGMPAALYMALARTMIRAHAPDHANDPAACLRAANNQIRSDTQSDLFVTVFYGILDPATGEMSFANAGHNPPLLYNQEGQPADLLRNTGMALGVLVDLPLENDRAIITPGGYLVLYTDGVTEAHDEDLNPFGYERLLQATAASSGASIGAATVHGQILAILEAFVAGAPQFDDLTLMVAGRKP
jgi:serine phosphatase RsbU (regulator of sigma subunit)